MVDVLKITLIAVILTGAGELYDAAEAKMPQPSGCSTETTKQHAFQVFWTNHTEVWTANSTVPYYECEWKELKNMNETGLQIVTHFDTMNTSTLNWTFAENDTMKSELKDGILRRRIVHQKQTCAVFRDAFFWRKTSKRKNAGKGLQYRLVFYDTNEKDPVHDCEKKYYKEIRSLKSYGIYRSYCGSTQVKGSP
uniref:Putative group i salivary lipocalin n=1 Tax=Rhipicephalus pulchellus TaxID=72859 RepID=L7M8R7_RHIPC